MTDFINTGFRCGVGRYFLRRRRQCWCFLSARHRPFGFKTTPFAKTVASVAFITATARANPRVFSPNLAGDVDCLESRFRGLSMTLLTPIFLFLLPGVLFWATACPSCFGGFYGGCYVMECLRILLRVTEWCPLASLPPGEDSW